MNCFAHGYRFLERDPWFVTGTVIPDWLTMVARRTRVRTRNARSQLSAASPQVAALARGIVQHHHDDGWFHNSRTFVELNMRFAIELRELLGSDAGFRPHLAAHIGIEMLLDSYLAERDISRLDRFYALIGQTDPELLELAVNRMAPRPTDQIAEFVPRFIQEGYLYDYLEDVRVRYRLNRVLTKMGMAELPPAFADWVQTARKRVYAGARELLNEPVPPAS